VWEGAAAKLPIGYMREEVEALRPAELERRLPAREAASGTGFGVRSASRSDPAAVAAGVNEVTDQLSFGPRTAAELFEACASAWTS
jgi:hypothetical protein